MRSLMLGPLQPSSLLEEVAARMQRVQQVRKVQQAPLRLPLLDEVAPGVDSERMIHLAGLELAR